MGSRLHGNDGRRQRTQIVIPATAGIHGGGPAMGSRLHGNDGRRRAHPTIVIPTTAGIHGPTIVIPATAGIHGEGPAMGSRLHGNDGPATGAPHNRHSRDGGNPRRGAGGDGFPSPRERRAATAHSTIVIPATAEIHGPTIVIPATAGIHGGGPAAMGSRLHGNDGRQQRTQIVIPATAGIHGGGPAMGSRLHGNDGRRQRTQIVIPATAGIHGGAPAMGSRLHGNDGRRRRTPQSSFPRRAEIHGPTIVFPANGGNPRRGAGGDGFPSPRERRAGHGRTPQSSFPRRRESTAGGRRWVPVSTGTTGRRRRTPQSSARIHGEGPAMGSRLHGNDGPAAAHPQGRGGQLASSLIEWRRSGAAR